MADGEVWAAAHAAVHAAAADPAEAVLEVEGCKAMAWKRMAAVLAEGMKGGALSVLRLTLIVAVGKQHAHHPIQLVLPWKQTRGEPMLLPMWFQGQSPRRNLWLCICILNAHPHSIYHIWLFPLAHISGLDAHARLPHPVLLNEDPAAASFLIASSCRLSFEVLRRSMSQ
jgi:hypothetical protein